VFQDSLFSQRPQAPAPLERVEGVSAVVGYIKRYIEGSKVLAGIRVRGEVTELRERNGRLYFSLKENADILRCMVWAGNAVKLPPFKNGDEIICAGGFSAYTPQGYYQLIVASIEHTGVGALYAQFEALKEQFRKEGLFEDGRKRQMPAFPTRIAVVSAEGGKGVEDFFTIVRRDAPYIEIEQIDTRVQGDGAEIDIAEAIGKASKRDVDLIVLTRGGGSYEDLFPFNREPVVRAIVRAKKPVVSAIGHTGDRHLSDLVADMSFETPSNAANYLAGLGKNLQRRVEDALVRLGQAARSIVNARAQAFDDATSRLGVVAQTVLRERERALLGLERRLNAQTPHARLSQRAERLTELRSRLEASARYLAAPRRERLSRASDRLKQLQTIALRGSRDLLGRTLVRLDGLDPHTLLARGYAIVTVDGRAVRDASTVSPGTTIEAQVARGKLVARVTSSSCE
jgi:exodeoxyribonuclease VII large subunit